MEESKLSNENIHISEYSENEKYLVKHKTIFQSYTK